MSDFFSNVAVNIIAQLAVVVLVAAAGLFTLTQLKRNWQTLRYAVRMKRAGISNFFCNRQEFGTLKQGRSLSDYILLAKQELIYVGFYLSGGADRGRVDDALRELLSNGCRIELVFFDPEMDDELLRSMEGFLAIAGGTLRGILQHAVGHFREFAATLSVPDRQRFSLRLHRTVLASSALLVDHDQPHGRVLIDTKIDRAGRDFSYAIEFSGAARAPSLAREYAKSFKRIAAEARPVAFP